MKNHEGHRTISLSNDDIDARPRERMWPEGHGEEAQSEKQGAIWKRIFALPREERIALVIVRRLNFLEGDGTPKLLKELCNEMAKAAGLKKTKLYGLAKLAAARLAA